MENSKTDTNFSNTIKLNDIHSSWIQSIPYGDLLNSLRQSPRVENIISKHIYSHLQIKQIDKKDDLENGFNSINSYQKLELQLLVMRAGALQFSQPIKSAIKKQEIDKICNSLGKELYNFVLHGDTVSTLHCNDAFKSSKDNTILADVINAGYHSLHITFNGSPNDFVFKLPKQWHDEFLSTVKKQDYNNKNNSFHKNLIGELMNLNLQVHS